MTKQRCDEHQAHRSESEHFERFTVHSKDVPRT
jgi:hypothetical protein